MKEIVKVALSKEEVSLKFLVEIEFLVETTSWTIEEVVDIVRVVVLGNEGT